MGQVMSVEGFVDELAEIELKLKALRGEERLLRERRGELLERFGDTMGGGFDGGGRSFDARGGRLEVKRERVVSFPTQSSDPGGQERLREALMMSGSWARMSMLNYAAMKAAWRRSRGGDSGVGRVLGRFARERDEVGCRFSLRRWEDVCPRLSYSFGREAVLAR